MRKFMQTLHNKIKDEKAAFILLGIMVITFALNIGANEYIKHTRLAEANANAETNYQYENELTENKLEEPGFSTLEDVTSQEDLAKLEEKQEEKEDSNETEKPTKVNTPQYYIKVNYGAQVVNVYKKDSNGEYTIPVRAMVCSTGTHTPKSGVYTIGYRWEWLKMIGGVYGHYVTQITGDILFHSVPYLRKGDHSSLEYWAYDQLGTKASLGCVRLTTKDAIWIYNNIASGTKVEFYSSSNPGPLGKPTARKISSAPSNVRGWDPTDPDKNNPWPKYLKELEEQENNKPSEEEKPDEKPQDPGKEEIPEEPDKKPGEGEENPQEPDPKPDTNEIDDGNANSIYTNETIDTNTTVTDSNDIFEGANTTQVNGIAS